MKMDLFSINLRKYSTTEEYEKLAADNNLPLDVEKLLEYRTRFTKIIVNKIDFNVIAVQLPDGEMKLSSEGIKSFSKVELLTMNTVEETFSVDGILDKIHESGLSSLTAKEKIFLKKNSK